MTRQNKEKFAEIACTQSHIE